MVTGGPIIVIILLLYTVLDVKKVFKILVEWVIP